MSNNYGQKVQNQFEKNKQRKISFVSIGGRDRLNSAFKKFDANGKQLSANHEQIEKEEAANLNKQQAMSKDGNNKGNS